MERIAQVAMAEPHLEMWALIERFGHYPDYIRKSIKKHGNFKEWQRQQHLHTMRQVKKHAN